MGPQNCVPDWPPEDRLISSLALSSNKLDPQKISILCSSLHQHILAEFPFVRHLPPCIHKYQHLAELAKHLPYPMNFVDEQAGERCHKKYKFSRTHLSRKTSAEDQMTDMMRSALAWSDMEMADYIIREEGSKKQHFRDKEFDLHLAEYYCVANDRVPEYDLVNGTNMETDSDDDENGDMLEENLAI